MSFEIRPMELCDIERVYTIEKSAHQAPWGRDVISECMFVGYDCRVLEITRGCSKQIMGYIICRKNLNAYHILNLCVDVFSQRKGYGQKLLQTVLDSLADTYFERVILEVRPSNKAALRLYEKFGFEEEMIKKGYYKDKKGEEDAILLRKIISPMQPLP
jgi:ribosomal-protein-alanine N-acetyltransferase